jgi:hypothetical protein
LSPQPSWENADQNRSATTSSAIAARRSEVERAAAAELRVAPAAFALGLLLLLGVWLPPPLARLVERIGMELMP